MTCDEWLRLIASATEGRVAPGPLHDVVNHLEACAVCCREAELQMEVKRVLASRPLEPFPERLALAIRDGLDVEDVFTARPPSWWPSAWRRLLSLKSFVRF